MVQLLLEKGADVNAVDCNGRTALMEAALWGRLRNVELLLNAGAEESKRCIDRSQLLRAVDFAKPLRKNAKERRWRAGLLYKEDTYARDRDREEIVRLLDDAADEPSLCELDGFEFQRPSNDRRILSLTILYYLPNEYKAVARMIRGGGLLEVSAISGWLDKRNQNIDLAGDIWTANVFKLCDLIGFTLKPHDNDPRPSEEYKPGKFYACHAEKQLVAYFVHKHLFDELLIPAETSIESLVSGLTIKEEQEHEAEYKAKLRDLRDASPDPRLKKAFIVVNKPICEDCKLFMEKVNSKLELNLQLRHCCLDPSCTECSNRVGVPQTKFKPVVWKVEFDDEN
ncbi:DYW family of nucleic acid deaminases-domain-containing protein [Daldinia bambusicola]|nr:DYW family of nucleic acid deaminases-domain-containing protein [Daldinia bambusicola]